MKTMRSALLAVGVVAALITTTAHAQVVGDQEELVFSGQIQLGAVFLEPVAGAPAGTFVPAAGTLESVGFNSAGSLFSPGPVYPGGLTPFTFPPFSSTADQAIYTYHLFGLTSGPAATTAVLNPGNGHVNINQSFSGGTLVIYQNHPHGIGAVANPFGETKVGAADPASAFTPLNYGPQGSTIASATGYADGNIWLMASVGVDSTFDATIGTGSYIGTLAFTGGSLYTQFLLPHGLTVGTITGTTSSAGPPTWTLGLTTQGRVDVIPEPRTLALFGAGLLPLGMFLRRRRA